MIYKDVQHYIDANPLLVRQMCNVFFFELFEDSHRWGEYGRLPAVVKSIYDQTRNAVQEFDISIDGYALSCTKLASPRFNEDPSVQKTIFQFIVTYHSICNALEHPSFSDFALHFRPSTLKTKEIVT